jgi:hypothetical protein
MSDLIAYPLDQWHEDIDPAPWWFFQIEGAPQDLTSISVRVYRSRRKPGWATGEDNER